MPTESSAESKAHTTKGSDTAEAAVEGTPIVFEDALDELENLVSQMEGGDLSLNDSLKAFERGVKLARLCQTALQEAELKVQTLSADGELTDLNLDDD